MLLNCCFTGHRKLKLTPEIIQRLQTTLEMLIEQGVTDFYAGGALGWDMICEIMIIKLRREYPQIKLHLVLPCSEAEQTAKWTENQKKLYHKILLNADYIEYTSDSYFNGCMQIRNNRLIEMADCCICYYDSKKSASGTGQTVRIALKKNIKIINLAE